MTRKNMNMTGWKKQFLLPIASYALYLIMWLILDDEIDEQLYEMTVADCVGDFLLCVFFTYISLGASYFIFRILKFRTSYVWRIVYASCLLILNNVIAFGMLPLLKFLWGETGNGLLDELFDMKSVYIFAMISTFISSIYANTFYLRYYIRMREERQRLEVVLMQEKEIALQSQLNALKLQINPHFMFNNFNNLLELIEEDTGLASKFLSNLSKVYRYIIANLDKSLIPVAEEMKFLDSYLYLMKVRYAESIMIRISPEMRDCTGFIPPAVLQLLVENAIKHNGFSLEHPLVVTITLSDDYITVRNVKSPLLSQVASTGLGLKNIRQRYALLSDKKVRIENAEDFYSVSLPVINNCTNDEYTDS